MKPQAPELLPVMSPAHNLREIAKQCVLLEDHLNNPQKRCPDCIRKHFLTIEAFFEEAISLDVDFEYVQHIKGKAEQVREWCVAWAGGRDGRLVAQQIRGLRKTLPVKAVFTKFAGGCPHRLAQRIASRHVDAMSDGASRALMKWLSVQAKRLGVSKHTYVVGGAVRNFVLKKPVKDVDVVIDAINAGKDSDWFARQLAREIPARTNIATNNYGVALLKIVGEWELDGYQMQGGDIEIANARSESYTDGGYKPTEVAPATIQEDIYRREFRFNTLMWRLHDLAKGPDKAEILDLTGCGLQDLKDGFARCPSDPDKTFHDDPSRMVRAVKFLVKYGLRPDAETTASIKKNRQKLWNIPHGQLSNLLIETFLRGPEGPKALKEMDKLGLIDVIRDIAIKEKPFREALANFASREAKLPLLFTLLDLNLPVGRRLSGLSDIEQTAVRTHTVRMTEGEAEAYLDALNRPQMDNKYLIDRHNIPPKQRGILRQLGRNLLVMNPVYVDKRKMTEAVDTLLPGHLGKTASAHRVATRHLEAGFSDLWAKWIAQPFSVIVKHHKEFVSGPVDDAVDAIIKDIAPVLVKAIGEEEVEEDVLAFLDYAQAGKADHDRGRPAKPRSKDPEEVAGYAWGYSQAGGWDGKRLPAHVREDVIERSLDKFRSRITEEVVIRALEKAWHAVNPVHTVKAMISAVKKHGWKLGVGFALFEIFEHFVLPAMLVALTGNKSLLALATLPIGEIIYAVGLRFLGRAPKELDKADPDGHLDWYEQEFGPIKLAGVAG